ncbi:DUF2267 domain-containing protein [Phytoactinopolyspora alkaliphila]|uniref:DUF2267 domain-containing protein n=1 Tax=Phytoactinopolyspora alkaliphila TaxID=1783498 RepID=A0A6N9YIF5_9ACTN|nr:DUF2267 domain-containing protein [Phytoactinopolyspora alkaliphila]NED94744.1 DUF2267 domain-containing protein [Phytoactinopolyspora alkaliphila]
MSERDEAGSGSRTLVVGLIADPGRAAEIAAYLGEHLPDDLRKNLTGEVTWRVEVRVTTLPLTEDGRISVVDDAERRMKNEDWDMMVYLTELPRRLDFRPHVFDLSLSKSAALVSLPALGWMRTHTRARKTVGYLIGRMSAHGLEWDGDDPRIAGSRDLTTEFLAGAREIDGQEEGVHTQLVLNGLRGKTRLLLGMIRTNRPWRLVPSMSTAIAAAVGIAAFGVFYSTIWEMGAALSPLRLVLVSVLAVSAMVTWLIVRNSLWTRASQATPQREEVLYNVSTIVTLVIGVAFMYGILFTLMLVSALVVIDPGFLESTLGHPASFTDYVTIAWLASSMGTVAGAIGSSLESEDAVKQAAYSKRQQEHLAQRKRQDRREREEEQEREERQHERERED